MTSFRTATIAMAVAAAMAGSQALAADGALAPGKPAGVHKAQDMGQREWLVFGGIAAVGIGVLIATSGGRSSNAQNQVVTVITTSATAP